MEGPYCRRTFDMCAKRLLYSFSLMRGDHILTFLLMNPSALLAGEVCVMCVVHFISLLIVIPRYFVVSVVFRSVLWSE